MRLAGLSEIVAMQISGHRTRAIFDRYDIVGVRELQDAAVKIELRFSKSLGTIAPSKRSQDLNHQPLGYEFAGRWQLTETKGTMALKSLLEA